MDSQTDVLVIGGGIVGVCAAYELAARGKTVVLVDQGGIAAGSSYGNAGLVVPSHVVPLAAPGVIGKALKWMWNPESPFYIKPRFSWELFTWLWKFRGNCKEGPMRRAIPVLRDLHRASVGRFDALAALEEVDSGYVKRGVLSVYRTEEGMEGGRHEAKLLEEFGLGVRVLDGAETRAFVPQLREGVVGAVEMLEDAHLNPALFVRGVAAAAEKKGVELRTETAVEGFERTGGRVSSVRTSRGEIRADQVVLAAGAWSSPVARDLKLKLPIQPAKGYSVTVKRPENCPEIPLILSETKVAVTPMGPLLRFAGTLEIAGLDLSINERRVEAIRRAGREYLEGMENLEEVEVWRGLRPCTPDGLPILGRPAGFENLIVAAGHAMIGVSLGPITGVLVAQIACGETPEFDLAPLRAERF